MDDTKLNIRVYNVGVGDCIYIYIPHPQKHGKENGFHILIDCGTASPGKDITSNALKDLKTLLPEKPPGKSHLDLLVISHAHEDHISGFDPSSATNPWYSDFAVDQLWMSSLMDRNNQFAKEAREIGELAYLELARLLSFSSTPEYRMLKLNPALMAAAGDLKEKQDFREKIYNALVDQVNPQNVSYLDTSSPMLQLFPNHAGAAWFQVLSPVREIDQAYLGKSLVSTLNQYRALHGQGSLAGGRMKLAQSQARMFDFYPLAGKGGKKLHKASLDELTISSSDFVNLYNRMISNSLAFAMSNSDMYNITGLALLLEWNGYRLLFPGDIEYTSPKGEEQGAWNVIGSQVDQGTLQLHQVDFLKVGHHGSDNATPWSKKKGYKKLNEILDALVKDPDKETPGENNRLCTIVVSTERIKSYQRTIPYAPLMEELGRRAMNRVNCYDEFEGYYQPRLEKDRAKNPWPPHIDYLELFKDNSVPINVNQPQRTDLYVQEPGQKVTYTDEFGLECALYIDFAFG